MGAFSEALDRYPIDRRPAKVAANIEGDTLASLRRARQRETRAEFAQARFAADAKPFADDFRAPSAEEPDAEVMTPGDLITPGKEAVAEPDAEEFHQAERALDRFIEDEVIDQDERFLILGVHLYERTLGDLAKELGISREAAKKRHLRAITRIRRSRSEDTEE